MTATPPHAPANVAPVIAIDGPAGAGKSTVARALADRLGFFLLDTGAIYRTVALKAARAGVGVGDEAALAGLAHGLPIRFDPSGRVLLADEDVSQAIRAPEISQGASSVSVHPAVRAALLDLQRSLASSGRCVVEGRDIGTVVLPWAPFKVFLTARAEVRAERRWLELKVRDPKIELDATLAEMNERDQRDASRQTAPLRAADDALHFDTSALSLEAVVDQLEQLARARLHV